MIFSLPRIGFGTRLAAKVAFPLAASEPPIESSFTTFGRARLHVSTDLAFLPPDLESNFDTQCSVTTWSSREFGDVGGGGYLRRYGSGMFAIHLATWWSKDNLEHHRAKLATQGRLEEVAECALAIAELTRRVDAIQALLDIPKLPA